MGGVLVSCPVCGGSNFNLYKVKVGRVVEVRPVCVGCERDGERKALKKL